MLNTYKTGLYVFGSSPNGIKCISDNKVYESFVVPKSEVYHIYKIIGFVRIQG